MMSESSEPLFSLSLSFGWVHVVENMEFVCVDDAIPLSGLLCKPRDWGSVWLLQMTPMYCVTSPWLFHDFRHWWSRQVQFHLRLTTFHHKYEHVFEISAHILRLCLLELHHPNNNSSQSMSMLFPQEKPSTSGVRNPGYTCQSLSI